MKIEWLAANATDTGTPTRAERDVLGQVGPLFVAGEALCDLETPS